ncbi:MAG: permease-like cell division protein FtsX [Pseudomonadota bacterium]
MNAKRGKNRRHAAGGGGRFAAWLEHHRLAVTDAFTRIIHRPLGNGMTASVLAVAIALPAALLLVVQSLSSVAGQYPDSRQISLFLAATAGAEDAQTLADELTRLDRVSEVRVLNPADELLRLENQFGDTLSALDGNPLPWTLVVLPTAAVADTAAVSALARDLNARPEVSDVLLDLEWLNRLNALLALAQRVVWVLLGLLALAALLIIGHTISLEIKGRQEEIAVSQLLGATPGFIRRPFLYLGLLLGLAAGVLAALVIAVSVMLVSGPANRLLVSYGSELTVALPNPLLGLALIGAGAGLGWLGANVAVLRRSAASEA